MKPSSKVKDRKWCTDAISLLWNAPQQQLYLADCQIRPTNFFMGLGQVLVVHIGSRCQVLSGGLAPGEMDDVGKRRVPGASQTKWNFYSWAVSSLYHHTRPTRQHWDTETLSFLLLLSCNHPISTQTQPERAVSIRCHGALHKFRETCEANMWKKRVCTSNSEMGSQNDDNAFVYWPNLHLQLVEILIYSKTFSPLSVDPGKCWSCITHTHMELYSLRTVTVA